MKEEKSCSKLHSLSDVYINVYDTKDARNISSPKEIMYLIVFKYVAFSALYV